jgi:hypothetical protein
MTGKTMYKYALSAVNMCVGTIKTTHTEKRKKKKEKIHNSLENEFLGFQLAAPCVANSNQLESSCAPLCE